MVPPVGPFYFRRMRNEAGSKQGRVPPKERNAPNLLENTMRSPDSVTLAGQSVGSDQRSAGSSASGKETFAARSVRMAVNGLDFIGARPLVHSGFKVEPAQRVALRALQTAGGRT